MSLTSEIKEYAQSLGAELFGVTSAEPFTRYIETVAELNGIHGLKDIPQLGKRINESVGDPKNILPDAQSIVVLGFFCKLQNHADDSLEYDGPHAQLASYWRNSHLSIVGIADSLVAHLIGKGFEAKEGRLPLKAVAARAGLGHFGKNTMLYTSEFGSWVALVGAVTNARLEPTGTSTRDICGKCQRCIDACPTAAIYKPYKLNVPKCRTYLNHDRMQDIGEISDSLKEKMRNLLCGCDVCQDVCPRNKKVKHREFSTSFNVTWHGVVIPDKARLPLPELLQLLEGAVDHYFQRYAAICIGNMEGAEEALPALTKMLSAEDPLVRKYAQWAITRIEKPRHQLQKLTT